MKFVTSELGYRIRMYRGYRDMTLSLFFGGAVLGTSACGRYHGKEVD